MGNPSNQLNTKLTLCYGLAWHVHLYDTIN
jgi:hypothetical protein